MGSRGWAFILLQLWGLQEAVSLSVLQWPPWVRTTQGHEMLLFCGVKQNQAWERLRVEWVRDNVVFCHSLISNSSVNPVGCGSRGQLSLWSPLNLSLRLSQVNLNDSGNYVCRATLEIPKLQEAEGNGTKVLVEAGGLQLKDTSSLSGLRLVLLVAGGVVAVLVLLGAVLWGLHRCLWKDSGESTCPENSFYNNVLYWPPRCHAGLRPKEKDTPRNQRAQAIYFTTFPKPAPRHQHQVSKPSPSPRPGHPISAHCMSSASPRR